MEKDRQKWDAKYRSKPANDTPAESVVHFAGMAQVGRALDIAAGAGRNAVYLAGLRFDVDAVDISDVGLKQFGAQPERIRTIHADLDTYEIPPQTYDLIVNINFLQRRLFPLIIEGLKPGGMLIFETFVEGDTSAQATHHCRDYLLRPNELLRAFLPLHILHYSEYLNMPPHKADHVASLVGCKR